MATDKAASNSGIGETVKVVIQALLLALVVRTFLFQPFSIPSGSMIPTLLVNDYLFVSKYAYGYSRHSFPFGIVPVDGRVWAEAPERGDIAVFKLPADNSTDYIKRVIGLPGDRIQMRDGQLFINGEPVERERAGEFAAGDRFGREISADLWQETLPNGVRYLTLDLVQDGPADDTEEFLVPPGQYFMMGDNRDNSEDSRIRGSGVGFVPFENFVGRAEVIFFSMEADSRPWMVWTWPWSVRWDRLFQTLR